MNLYLLIIGRNILEENAFDFKRFSIMLSDRDYKIEKIFYADDGDSISDVISGVDEDALFVVSGNLKSLYDFFGEAGSDTYGYVKIGNRIFVPMPTFDESTVKNTVIPLLNSKNKNNYNTVIIKTFGKSADELKETLKEFTKGRNKIYFDFIEDGQKCDVRVRYAKSVQSVVINDVITGVSDLLSDCIYALKDISLAKQVARSLIASGKKLSLAESFTGGGLASALVACPGMSNSLLESIVSYTNESKTARLHVPEAVISKSGAVSADTAFEMAIGLLDNPKCDIAIATTGNAGPTSEKDGQVGLYYIAVGDRQTVHVFERLYEVKNADTKSVEDMRQEITNAGIETALFELGKYLGGTKGDK